MKIKRHETETSPNMALNSTLEQRIASWSVTKTKKELLDYGLRVLASVGLMGLVLATGCAMQEQQTMQSLDQPINCATAQGDIRVLQSEKTHVAQQIASGATAIFPAGIVMGVLTGTESTKLQVASGDYNTMIDNRIAAIKAKCGV